MNVSVNVRAVDLEHCPPELQVQSSGGQCSIFKQSEFFKLNSPSLRNEAMPAGFVPKGQTHRPIAKTLLVLTLSRFSLNGYQALGDKAIALVKHCRALH